MTRQTASETLEPTAPVVEEPAAPAADAVVGDAVEDPAPADDPAPDAVIGDPIEDEVASDATGADASATDQAPAVEEAPAAPDAPAAPADSQTDSPSTAASFTDGTTADNNSPPVEEAVAANPTIASDKADYAAGTRVVLSGSNWQGDTEVAIVVNDTYGSSWRREVTVTVSPEGTITDAFTLPEWFVSDYNIAATGVQSGRVAKSTFTDTANFIGLDFAAATPGTYDHATGGGAWNDKSKQYVVESLEGGDFICGDTVSFLQQIKLDGSQANPANPRNIELTYQFLLDTTGQTGVALGPVVDVQVNPNDTGNNNDGNSVVTWQADNNDETSVPPYFTPGKVNTLTVQVTDLENTEAVILRIDVVISCKFAGTPTGNLQASLTGANVTNTQEGAIPAGGQTVPFQSTADLVFPGRIIVDKVTDPSGALDLFDFEVSAPGSDLVPAYFESFELADATTPFASGNVNPSRAMIGKTDTLIAGSYTIKELTLPAGWHSGTLLCTSDVTGLSVEYDVQEAVVSLREGETITCTFQNILDTARLTLVKTVTNDNGGTAKDTDWTLTATGSTTISGQTGSTAVTEHVILPGTYSLSESAGPAGYTPSAWTCVGADSFTATSVTVGRDDDVTCTITNDDIAPKLHLRKVVVNDNGGTATVADFTLTANGAGANDLSGTSPVDSGAGLQADTWALSETDAGRLQRLGLESAWVARRTGRTSPSASAARPPARSPTTTSRRSCTCARSWSTTTVARPRLPTSP